MGFASGAVSYCRYFMASSRPASVTDKFIERIMENAFGRHAPDPEGNEFGWISPRHLFDTDITAEKISLGRFVHLALRMDRLAIPAGVLKSYIRLEEEVALEASGREFLSKGERHKARDRAKLRAEKEVRAGGFRRPAAYPLLMDFDTRTVLFGSLGATVNEKMAELFKRTFDSSLEPADPHHLAHRLLDTAGGARGLENIEPSHLIRRPDAQDEDPIDFADDDHGFLGPEFLTWLWHKSEADHSRLTTKRGQHIAVAIEKSMRLVCDFGLTGTTVVTRDAPAGGPEARAALGIGKQPTKIGLIIGGDAGEFRFALDGTRMTVSGMILPDDTEDRDAVARLEHRFEQVIESSRLLDELYHAYLTRRTAAEWPRELATLSAWARSGGARAATTRPAAQTPVPQHA